MDIDAADRRSYAFNMRTLIAVIICMGIVGLVNAESHTSSSILNDPKAWHFKDTISSQVLENYLSRAIQCAGMCGEGTDTGSPHFEDDLRMIRNIGAKFIGRATIAWNLTIPDEEHFALAKSRAGRVHEVDPDIILHACIFEIVHTGKTKADEPSKVGVDAIPIPAWVFQEFDEKPVERTFDYAAMLSPDKRGVDIWDKGASAPDITRPETKKWFYYRARRYIDAGYEALHFGQAGMIGMNDPDATAWDDMLTRVRKYARAHARRGYVFCDAHTVMTSKDVPFRRGERLLWDFVSFPLRIAEREKPLRGELRVGYLDSMYGRVPGGLHPAGWRCQILPQLYEFDNCVSGLTLDHDGATVWGAEETTWFANQPEAYRNEFLIYAFNWISRKAPHGYLHMPGRRPATVPVLRPKVREYVMNNRSASCPFGFNQEETVKSLWNETTRASQPTVTSASIEVGKILPDVSTTTSPTLEQLRQMYEEHGMSQSEQRAFLESF